MCIRDRLIAVQAEGGLRDALSILDQCSNFDDDAITVEKVRRLLGLIGGCLLYTSLDAVVNFGVIGAWNFGNGV